MAETKTVAGDVTEVDLQRLALLNKFEELGRQIKQPSGYKFDFNKLMDHLQNAVEGKFELIVLEQSEHYKQNLKKFYLEAFGKDLSDNKVFTDKKLSSKNGFQHFMFVLQELSCNDIREAEKRIFDSSYSYWNDVDASIKHQQKRPGEDYWGAHEGGNEPDKTHRNKSYNMFSIEDATYMIVKEYSLCRLFAYWFNKQVWDKKGVTLTHTLSVDDWVMYCDRSNDEFSLDWFDRDGRDADFGPRSVEVF